MNNRDVSIIISWFFCF